MSAYYALPFVFRAYTSSQRKLFLATLFSAVHGKPLYLFERGWGDDPVQYNLA